MATVAVKTLVTIDGSVLEGGGQILRNASALACLTGQSININSIRAGRNNPGLRPQHLLGLTLIRDISRGSLQGDSIGSSNITFHPAGSVKGGTYTADTKTAGSTCLLLQSALPCVLFADGPVELCLKGGTNAEMAPPIDYYSWVFGPMATRFGVKVDCDIIRRGYFPKGGGEVRIKTQPVKQLSPVDLTDLGDVVQVTGRAYVAGALPPKISHIMAKEATSCLQRIYNDIPIKIEALREPQHSAIGNGSGLIIMAETSTGCRLAGSALGKRGLQAEEVGRTAADMLLSNLRHGGCVDDFLQDQLIIFMALACGQSQVRCGPITLHTETAIHVAKTLTKAEFTIEKVNDDQNIISCTGIGLQNSNC